MKKYIWALFSVLFVGVELVYAERNKSYTENFDLPIVTASTTELGFGNYLESGAALLLGGSEAFTRAWPDLGYEWSAVVDRSVCSDIEVNRKRAKVDIGRVRVVLPKVDDQGQAVGFELIPIRSDESSQGKGHKKSGGDENLGLVFGELCTVIGDEIQKATIEAAMIFVASYLAPGVPASGKWKSNKAAGTPAVKNASSYQMVWSGKILDAGVAKKMATWGGKVLTWRLGADTSVVWRPHSWEMMSEGGAGTEKENISFDANRALTLVGTNNAEFYLIGKKSGGLSGYWSTPKSLSLEEGQVKDAGELASLKDVEDLEIWTKTQPTWWAGISKVPRMWLVTEKAIPVFSLKPSVYLKGYAYW